MTYAVEVVYATPEEQCVIAVEVNPPATIRQAIVKSGMLERFKEIVLTDENVGVFAYRLPLDHLIEDGDRIEIYRPLQMSPTEARRIRAAAKSRVR